RAPRRWPDDSRKGHRQAPVARSRAGADAAHVPLAAGRTDREPGVDEAGSPAAPAPDVGRSEATPGAGKPGPAGPARGRGPPLDRFRDTSVAGLARRRPADGADALIGHLPAGVPPRLGEQDVLPAAAA